jgi:hypothetical protein
VGDRFEERADAALAIYAQLKRYGIYYFDLTPQNVAFVQ